MKLVRGSSGSYALDSLVVVLVLTNGCSTPTDIPPPAPAPPPPPKADLVLTEGLIHTMMPKWPVASAVAVLGTQIVAVGDQEAVAPWIGPNTRHIRLGGRTVVPGLVDSHVHLIRLGRRRSAVDLVGATTLGEAIERVRRAAEDTPPGQWIRGLGWDQNDWADHPGLPTAADLDAVTPDHPVILTRVDGHAIWVNSQALRLAGIDASTRSPPGGQIVRRRHRPTGVFVDRASALVRGHVPPPTPEELEQAILLGQGECLAAGLTQVHEMGIGPDELAALRRLDDRGQLRLRVYAMLSGALEDLTPYMKAGPQLPADDRRLTVRGFKFYLDGALGSRGAALLQPYSDDNKALGLILTPPELLEARIRTAKTHGFQVAVHAIGDRANRLALDIFERVYGADDGRHRPRIEHAQVIHPNDLDRFAQLGVIASIQPTHATSDMPWAERRIGRRRARTSYAWQSLLRSGAKITAGSDAPVEAISPLLGLYAAATRKTPLGLPKDGWFGAERLSRTQALAAFTTFGAYASFRESEAGRIAPGQVADLTVIDKDPLTATEDELASMQTMLTVVGGRVEFAKPGADTAITGAAKTSSAGFMPWAGTARKAADILR